MTRDEHAIAVRGLSRYRDVVLNGATDHDIMTLAGGGNKKHLWLMPPECLEREFSKALGQIEVEKYGRFRPEWIVTPHNTLAKAFAIQVLKSPMP